LNPCRWVRVRQMASPLQCEFSQAGQTKWGTLPHTPSAMMTATSNVCLSDVITGTDLENAFGRMYRSASLRAVRALVIEVLPMLAGQWRNSKVIVLGQQIFGTWTKFESERGG